MNKVNSIHFYIQLINHLRSGCHETYETVRLTNELLFLLLGSLKNKQAINGNCYRTDK